jgi:hypothetical protein
MCLPIASSGFREETVGFAEPGREAATLTGLEGGTAGDDTSAAREAPAGVER